MGQPTPLTAPPGRVNSSSFHILLYTWPRQAVKNEWVSPSPQKNEPWATKVEVCKLVYLLHPSLLFSYHGDKKREHNGWKAATEARCQCECQRTSHPTFFGSRKNRWRMPVGLIAKEIAFKITVSHACIWPIGISVARPIFTVDQNWKTFKDLSRSP